jgi:flavin reductase (DIM6/NTAB) family NADH-FMN oxidoreductase RutF
VSSPSSADDPGPTADDQEAGLDDRLRRRVLWAIPTGLFLVGSRLADERNLMAANLVVQACIEPKLVSVSIEREAVTARLVDASARFSLTMLSPQDRAVVRRFVKPVSADDVELGDAGQAVSMRTEAVFEAPSGCPVLSRAVAWLDCEVRHRLELGSHVLFVGEVTGVGGPDGDVPAVLTMADTRMNYGG